MIKRYFILPLTLSIQLIASNWNAQYHKTSSWQYLFAQAQLSHMKLVGNEKILDMGCGTGRTSNFYADHIPEGSILGVDASANMIQFAQKEYESVKNLRFQVADVSELNFNEEFDLIYSFFCLQWVEDKERALQGIYNALKKNGRAYIYVPVASDDFKVGLRCINEALACHPEWQSSVTIPSSSESPDIWIDRIAGIPLTVVHSHVLRSEKYFASKEEYYEYCYALGLTSLPEPEKKQFISEIIQKVYQHYQLQDNDPYIRVANILALELVKK